jgi:hypothetical protein
VSSDGAKAPSDEPDPTSVAPTVKLHVIALTDGPNGTEFTAVPSPLDCSGGSHTTWPCDIQSTLEAHFRSDTGGALCVTHSGAPTQCLDFETEAVWTLDDIQASAEYLARLANDNPAAPSDPCLQFILGGSDDTLCPDGTEVDTGGQAHCAEKEHAQWLAEVGSACGWEELLPVDPWAVPVVMFSNTVGTDSYGTWRAWQPDHFAVVPEFAPSGYDEPYPEMCSAAVFIEGRRHDPGVEEYDQRAINHELGHAFGLDHVCYLNGDAASGGNNVMASGVDGRCCCECGEQVLRDYSLDWDDDDTGLSSADVVAEPRMGSYLATVCQDCSTEAGNSGDCVEDTGEPYASCDPTCGENQLEAGNREGGFTNALPGQWYPAPPSTPPPPGWKIGQIERIQEFITARQVCKAAADASESRRLRPLDAAYCAPGAGTFALIPETVYDGDDDGFARHRLQPVLLAGDHLPPDAWITEVSLAEGGTPGHVLVSRVGVRVEGDPTDPDLLDAATVQRLDASQDSWVPSLGEVSARASFWAEDQEVGSTQWSLTEVELEWDCTGSSGLPAPIVQSVSPGWLLPVDAVASGFSGEQELILRPNQTAGELGVVFRGRPDAVVKGSLVATGDPDVWTFAVSWEADTLAGTLEWVPAAGGHETLTLSIDSGSLQGLDLSGTVVTEIQPW